MARDALRRVDAPVRPARTVLWTLTWALALCLPLAACDGGDPADPDPGVSLGEAAGGCCDAPEGDGVPLGSVAGMFLLGAAGRRRRQA